MMKKILAAVMVFVFVMAGFGSVTAFAYHGMKGGHGGMELEEYFCGEAMKMIFNAEALGLSTEQVDKIKKLKFDTKRYLVSKNAEIEVVWLDIEEHMWQDKLNIETINNLIDKKFELKKEKTKAIVKAISDLKGMLTEEQQKTLKSLGCGGPRPKK